MNRRQKALLLAVVAGLLAFLLNSRLIASANRTEGVLQFTRDVQGGEKIGEADVEVVQLPAGLFPDALRSKEAAVGKMARGFYPKGTVVRNGMVTAEEVTLRVPERLNALSESGLRAIAVQATLENTVGRNLRPGDRIDLYGVGKGEASLIQTAVPVLSAPAPSKDGTGGEAALVLALSEEDARRLLEAIGRGSHLYALLRPTGEAAGVRPPDRGNMTDQTEAPAPGGIPAPDEKEGAR